MGSQPLQEAGPRIAGAVCVLTPAARELGRRRLVGRVAKRFGYFITTVTVFCALLFIIPVLNTCVDFKRNQRWLLRELQACALVVTCVPAAVEPLIYTLLYKLLPSSLTNNR